MLRRAPTWLLIAALGVVGCGPGGGVRSADDTDAADPAVDDTDESGDTDQLPEYEGPHFWGLDGVITLADGKPTLDMSSLQASFYDREGKPWQAVDEDPYRCDLQVIESVLGPDESLDGEPLLGWWQMTVDAPTDAPCPWTVPSPDTVGDTELAQVVVGLGPFDGRLLPQLEAAGLDPALDLYGLYVLHPAADGDVVYIFGVAGTDAQFAGSETTVDGPPLPPGAYRLQSLVLLPIPEATQR